MAAAVPEPRRPSPNTAARETATLSVNLSSNNPFRNRAVSPGLLSVSPRSFDTTQNRMSRNPFLDVSDFPPAQPTSKEVNGLTADIFGDLSLLDGPANDAPPSRVAPRVPPPRSAAPPVNAPRPFGSEQRRDRPRDPMAPTGASTRLPTQRPRGLSASSVMGGQEHEGRKDRERSDRPPRTESEERKRRERRKERDERHKREKEKIRTGGRTKKPQGLDIIDKLDVTGIYGQGLFHHDGPFDACNPHRNVKKDRRAPMEAFPANSANMALGGAGPLNSHIDLDRFHGRGEEAFDTFGGTRKTEANIVDPTKRGEYVHGTESTGLGTSTFLDGAPASRRDITRRDSDDKPTGLAPGGGLSRKKSIAQRFRGMSNNRRGPGYETRSPEARYHQASNSNDDAIEVSPPTHKAISAGGPARAAKYNNENEVNPFDQDYENAYARKGAQIRIAEQERPSAQRNLSASSAIPTGSRLGLTRSITADSPRPGSNEGEKPSGGGGFLNRMKSLKGGRRTRPERPER